MRLYTAFFFFLSVGLLLTSCGAGTVVCAMQSKAMLVAEYFCNAARIIIQKTADNRTSPKYSFATGAYWPIKNKAIVTFAKSHIHVKIL